MYVLESIKRFLGLKKKKQCKTHPLGRRRGEVEVAQPRRQREAEEAPDGTEHRQGEPLQVRRDKVKGKAA